MDIAQDNALDPFLGDLSRNEKPTEIKPPLYVHQAWNSGASQVNQPNKSEQFCCEAYPLHRLPGPLA